MTTATNSRIEKTRRPHARTALTTAMRMVWTLVTPGMAEKWLEGWDGNRPLNWQDVVRLACDMRAGHWRKTHEPIAIDANGCMIDGQHRMWAILESGTSQWMWVCHECETDTFPVIDTGRPRRASDALAIHGEAYCKAAAAVCSREWRERHQGVKSWSRSKKNEETVRLVSTRPMLMQAVEMVHNACRKGGQQFYASALGWVMWHALEHDEASATEFLHGLTTGVGLERNDPRLIARNRLMRKEVTAHEQAHGLARAWRAFAEGRKLTRLLLVNSDGTKIPPLMPGEEGAE